MKIRSRALPAAVLASLALALTCTAPAMGAKRQHPALRHVSITSSSGDGTSEEASSAHPLRWVHGRLPSGGSIANGAVVHTIGKNESWQSIAEDYLDLTGVYDVQDLAKAIVKENLPESKKGAHAGLKVRIPHILDAAPKTGAAERMGMPKDGIVKGIYVRGSSAGGKGFPALLDRVASHGMNAITLDVKDYDGPLTYASKIPLAVESGAVHKPPIRSWPRAVRFAHEHLSLIHISGCARRTTRSRRARSPTSSRTSRLAASSSSRRSTSRR